MNHKNFLSTHNNTANINKLNTETERTVKDIILI